MRSRTTLQPHCQGQIQGERGKSLDITRNGTEDGLSGFLVRVLWREGSIAALKQMEL